MQSVWLPIETAPKDFSWFLITDGIDVEKAYYNPYFKNQHGEWFEHWVIGECDDDFLIPDRNINWPKYWMPLPNPPEQ